MRYELARIRPPLAHGRNGGQTQDRIRLGLMTSACLWFHGNFPEEIDGERNCSHCARRERKIRSDLMFVAAGAWWLVSEANQRNDSRGTSLLSYPAVLNSYPFPVIHPRALVSSVRCPALLSDLRVSCFSRCFFFFPHHFRHPLQGSVRPLLLVLL